MRKARFTEEQIIAVLKEHAAGTPAQELGRRLGVGGEAPYRWKGKYGGLEGGEGRGAADPRPLDRPLREPPQRRPGASGEAAREGRGEAAVRLPTAARLA